LLARGRARTAPLAQTTSKGRIVDMTAELAAPLATPPSLEQLLERLRAAAYKAVDDKDFGSALAAFKKIVELVPTDVNARFLYAQLINDGSHKKRAEARDMMLAILDEHPEIFDTPTDGNLNLIRKAAISCKDVGPVSKAIDLFRRLAKASNQAVDYMFLSEVLAHGDLLEESLSSLETGIALDPSFDTPANRETLALGRSRLNQPAAKATTPKKKIGRYPETKDFLGDIEGLITNHIAVDLNREPKFITKDTRFFTMGSCFARNLARSLEQNGYVAQHMEISEYINTTFANRIFVDWLSGAEIDAAIRDRIGELLPAGWSRENTLQIIKDSRVFILTLGVAPAFFDRATGDFVLPRPSALNSRVLAEKYVYRTTSVQENVDNVLYLINFVRSISPAIKVVVTVSPVPLLASFEYESAVQADCLSKSTMRLVAHEVVNNSGVADIVYWPSFEVFRWAGSNASNFYAADDGAAWHVSEEKVGGTIKAFVDMFSVK
jgi:tetratricopeptide (TPR) repeat protein